MNRLPQLYQRFMAWTGADPMRLPIQVAVHWPWLFYRQLQEDKAFIRAAGMAYATLIALVPMLVLVYAVLGAIGLAKDPEAVNTLLFGTFLGEIPEVRDFLLPGLRDIDLRALSLTGTGVLLLVAGRLFLSVERAYSDIFGVPINRKFSVRILNFYFTLTAGPIVVVVTVMGTFQMATGYDVHWLKEFITTALQWVLLLSALKLFPNTKVNWLPAFAGAGVSWALLEAGGRVFSWYVKWFASDDPLRLVYGAVGLLPVFLLWLYMVWIFILLGVEVANVVQNYNSLMEAQLEQVVRARRHVRSLTLETALQVLSRIAWHFHHGKGPVEANVLSVLTGLPARDIHSVAAVFCDAGLLVHSDAGWLPARPPSEIELQEIVCAWRDNTVVRGNDTTITKVVDEALRDSLQGDLGQAMLSWLDDDSAETQPGVPIPG